MTRKMSDEHKKAISEAKKGKKLSEEHKKAIADSKKGTKKNKANNVLETNLKAEEAKKKFGVMLPTADFTIQAKYIVLWANPDLAEIDRTFEDYDDALDFCENLKNLREVVGLRIERRTFLTKSEIILRL